MCFFHPHHLAVKWSYLMRRGCQWGRVYQQRLHLEAKSWERKPPVTWHCVIQMSAFWDLDVKRVREDVHGNGADARPSLLQAMLIWWSLFLLL